MSNVSKVNEKTKNQDDHLHLESHHHIFVIILVMCAALLLGSLAKFSIKGSLADYQVAGIKFSKMSDREKLKKSLQQEVNSKNINIIDKDYNVNTYNIADAGLYFNADKTIDRAYQTMKDNGVLKNSLIFKEYNTPLVFDKDDFLVDKFVDTAMTVKVVDPTDATLDTSSGSVVITEDKTGNYYTVDNAKNRLLGYLAQNRTATFKLENRVIQPKVTAASLKTLAENVQSIVSTDVQIGVMDETYTPDETTKLSWITNENARYSVKKDKVIEYLDKIAGGYETNPTRQVSLKRADGSEQIIFRGSGGLTISNKQEVADKIAQSMVEKQPVHQSLSVKASDPTRILVNDYPKWIIVNLSTLQLDAYENSNRIFSFPVSAGLKVSPTITGEFKIYQKNRRQTMRGINGYGQPYNVPNVEWISYFSGNYGIHGNYWAKPEYFGAVNSTSGCVGLRNSDAQPLWEWAPVGTPVIVHY